MKHFHDDPDPPPFIKALAEVRQLHGMAGATSISRPSPWQSISTPASLWHPEYVFHGSVRLFHAQLLTKPAPTFRVSHETKRILHDIIFGRQRQSPETRLAHDYCITNTGVPSCSSCSSPPEQSGLGLLLQR